MGIFRRLFRSRLPPAAWTHKDGRPLALEDEVACGSCGKTLRIRGLGETKRVVFASGPETFRGLALRCQDCGFHACVDCVRNPRGGIYRCPSCGEVGGPALLADLLALRNQS